MSQSQAPSSVPETKTTLRTGQNLLLWHLNPQAKTLEQKSIKFYLPWKSYSRQMTLADIGENCYFNTYSFERVPENIIKK